MSEFSQEAINSITSYLNNIKRCLTLKIEGDYSGENGEDILIFQNTLEEIRRDGGKNILLYGVPGSGKSWTIEHEYCHQDSIVERLVFHPDYTNADFIGQILPVIDEKKQVTYEFTPGPFTTIIKEAFRNPMLEYILIIEEINRGNAPAIFGEVFQLLDRMIMSKNVDGINYPVGTSEYGITHKYMAEKIYGDSNHKVRIPSNLSIIGTMNTSDQNVFTLDTAFQRRWKMRMIKNEFKESDSDLKEKEILDTGVTWGKFWEVVNKAIVKSNFKLNASEDKRLGTHFIQISDLEIDAPEGYHPFPEKVLKYLWDDAFKFYREEIFNTTDFDNLESIIETFIDEEKIKRLSVFNENFVKQLVETDK